MGWEERGAISIVGGTCSWVVGGAGLLDTGACGRGDGTLKRGGGEITGGELTGVAE